MKVLDILNLPGIHCRISKYDTSHAVEKTLPVLLLRTGDTAVRIREAAKAFTLDQSKFEEVRVSLVMCLHRASPNLKK